MPRVPHMFAPKTTQKYRPPQLSQLVGTLARVRLVLSYDYLLSHFSTSIKRNGVSEMSTHWDMAAGPANMYA